MACRWMVVLVGSLALPACSGDDDAGPGASGGDGGAGTAASSTSGGGPESAGTFGGGGPAQCEGDDSWGGGQTSGGDGSGGDGSGGDGTLGMDDDMPLAVEVYDVQQGVTALGELVAFDEVVVTSPAAPADSGHGYEVFVQDPMGGPYSGIRVRLDFGSDVQVGEAVSVTGRVRGRGDFYLVDAATNGGGMQRLGPGVLPEPDVLSAEDLAPDSAVARPYEGVPVRVQQVVVTDADPCDGEFQIDDTARVDDRFVPGQLVAPPEGTMLVTVEGVLIYAVDAFELAPRTSGEVQ